MRLFCSILSGHSPVPEFFLLGFGVSVKIALKVARSKTSEIPDNVFIYLGTMVFGCLVAQDVIRLSHDAFKVDGSPSSGHASASIIKRVFWLLRFAVDGLVFSVVYARDSIGILPFLATLFSLCLIKCFTPAAAHTLIQSDSCRSLYHQVRLRLRLALLFPKN